MVWGRYFVCIFSSFLFAGGVFVTNGSSAKKGTTVLWAISAFSLPGSVTQVTEARDPFMLVTECEKFYLYRSRVLAHSTTCSTRKRALFKGRRPMSTCSSICECFSVELVLNGLDARR